MEDFRIAQPEYLFGLLLLPLLFWILGKLGRNARERLLRFVSEANLRTLLRESGGRGSGLKTAFFWAGLVFLLLALARPQANPITEEMEGTSLDIYVLLDVSKSMDAEDIAPSRLKKAKREIQSLMSLLAGDRLGLIAFAGSSVIVSPLTSDYEVVRTFLQNVDTNLIQNQTTDIQGALTMAEEAMRRGAERAGDAAARTNVFVVMSDGEDQSGDPDYSVVNKIKSAGGTIFTIAFGTEAGGKIPVRNERGELMGYKRNRANGQEVNTSVATKSLQEIASLGGGQFYFSTQDEGEVRDILNRMQNMQRAGAVTMRARVYQEYFWPFLALGTFLIVLSFLSLRALLGKIGLKRFAPGAAAFLVIALLPSPRAEAAWLSFLWDKERRASEKATALAGAGKTDEAVDALKGLLAENPDSAALNYNVGTYYLNGKKAKEGREQLERLRASGSPLKHRGLYNIAGSYAAEQRKDEARAAYAELIAGLGAKEDPDAGEKQLLEMARQNLARLADQNQPPPQQQQQNQQNQDQQNKDQKEGDGQKKDQSGEGKDQKDSKDEKDGKKPEDAKDQKDQDKKDGKDPKDGEDAGDKDKDKDGKEPKDPKDDGKEKSEEEKKKEEEAKAKEEQGKEQDGQGQKPSEKRYMSPKGFKERENLSGEDAKRLLEELKLHETNLQKKFLRKKDNGGEFRDDGAAKDW
jgi:Ca-activated chloride channel homolog